MSSKTVAVTAIAVAVAATAAEANLNRLRDQMIRPPVLINRPVMPFEEEEWQFDAGIQGGQGRPQWKVGVSHSWEEEEQKLKIGKALKKATNILVKANDMGLLEEEEWEFNAGIQGGQGRPQWQAGISHKWDEEEEQKFKLKKALKKAAKIASTAVQLGLLEEESEEQKLKIGKAIKKVAKIASTAQQLGLLEEEEWEFNAGIQGGQGRPQWQVGVSHSWDEEEEQKFKIGKALKKVAKVASTAQQLGLLEEEEQKFKIGKALKKVAKVASTAQQLGLLEEEEEAEQKLKLGKLLKKAAKIASTAQQLGLLEEEEGWEFDAGIQGGQGRPQWKVGVSGSWEEEEQKFKIGKALKKVAKVAAKAHDMGLLEEEDSEQKFKIGKALKKAGRVLAKAHEIGLLEEDADEEQKFKLGKALKKAAKVLAKAHEIGVLEEEEWQVNAGISGGQGRPQWQVGVSHSWDEEEQKFKIGKAIKKVAKVAAKAHDMGLLEEDEAQWNSPTFPVNPRPYM